MKLPLHELHNGLCILSIYLGEIYNALDLIRLCIGILLFDEHLNLKVDRSIQ